MQLLQREKLIKRQALRAVSWLNQDLMDQEQTWPLK